MDGIRINIRVTDVNGPLYRKLQICPESERAELLRRLASLGLYAEGAAMGVQPTAPGAPSEVGGSGSVPERVVPIREKKASGTRKGRVADAAKPAQVASSSGGAVVAAGAVASPSPAPVAGLDAEDEDSLLDNLMGFQGVGKG